MSNETDDKSVVRVITFLKNILDINRNLQKSKEIVDSNSILKYFKQETNHDDSGFDSEAISDCHEYSASSTHIKNFIFEKNNVDTIFEHALIFLCKYIKQKHIKSYEDQIKLDSLIDFIIDFIKYLSETSSKVPFREIIHTFLNKMLNSALQLKYDTFFEYTMQLHLKFSCIQELHECVIDTLIKGVTFFSKTLKNKEVDATFSFLFETDFSRIKSVLFTIMMILTITQFRLSRQNEEDLKKIFEYFSKSDDFFILAFFSYKCLLQE